MPVAGAQQNIKFQPLGETDRADRLLLLQHFDHRLAEPAGEGETSIPAISTAVVNSNLRDVHVSVARSTRKASEGDIQASLDYFRNAPMRSFVEGKYLPTPARFEFVFGGGSHRRVASAGLALCRGEKPLRLLLEAYLRHGLPEEDSIQ